MYLSFLFSPTVQKEKTNFVCDGFILFNISGSRLCELWAYDVNLNKWHLVQVKNTECYSFRVDRTQLGGYGMQRFPLYANRTTQQLVHLLIVNFVYQQIDLINFCLLSRSVASASDLLIVNFLKLITTFQLVEQSKINITHSTVYEVPLEDSMTFHVRSCFTL